ncbi:DUF6334 family protein [Pontibacter akesuensis]|uniref:Uncharacterized protein n=1 Tax=Pontibacter akesuensis TaxID=388950 RepID=A0A1I7K2Y5_9BACT|nr:DUF6334 family protein [Pontibacter akesuensis]GHA75486.1 hypothetical protein GCM10007389_31700 [Pontibacter akesuensis]SFU91787.1 hypothetical protein SAMN04487941_3333 [Pontibacter akesuensis]
MEDITDFDILTGQEVTHAYALHDLENGLLQQVLFQLEDMFLLVSLDVNSDEVVLSMLPQIDFTILDRQFSRTQIANRRKRILYIWRMTNQRGYDDGFQMEFDDVEQTHVQLIAEGNSLALTIFNKRG